jgi:predicted acylesterase/phospholipase RssA
MMADAETFRGRHLLTYSLDVHFDYRYDDRLKQWCGVIPERLRQLQSATFARLHHGIGCLGIVCHDVAARCPRYFWTGQDRGVALYDIVRASASIPWLFPAISVTCDDQTWRLTDGGISNPVPIEFARGPSIGATHVIVSDCRWLGTVPNTDDQTVWIRPRMGHTGTLWSPRQGLVAAVRNGEAAVTRDALDRIGAWLRPSVRRSNRSV